MSLPQRDNQEINSPQKGWDVFISYAWEDRDVIARPLANALEVAGLKVWFAESVLVVGDSLRRSIDNGLVNSRYGIVILSHNFFAKEWPQRELDGLVAREIGSKKVILPIWHNIDYKDISVYSPMLADKLGIKTENGLAAIVEAVTEAIQKDHHPIHFSNPISNASRKFSFWQARRRANVFVLSGLVVISILGGYFSLFRNFTFLPIEATMKTTTPTPTVTQTLTPTPTLALAPNPKISTIHGTTFVTSYEIGQEFILEARFEGNGSVDGAQTRIDFDPADMEVVAIINGPAFLAVLISEFDNKNGRIDYHAANVDTPPQVPVTFFVIKFRVKRLFRDSLIQINSGDTLILDTAHDNNDYGNDGEIFLVTR